MRSSTSSYTAMLSILLANRVDDRYRNSHGCPSRCSWRYRDWVRSRSTTTNRSSLRRRVGVRNRVRSGSAATDRWVLGRRVGVRDRIRTGSTTSAERRSNHRWTVGDGYRVRSGTTTTWERSTSGRVGREWTTAGKGSTLGWIDREWAWSTAMTGRGRVRAKRWTTWIRA